MKDLQGLGSHVNLGKVASQAEGNHAQKTARLECLIEGRLEEPEENSEKPLGRSHIEKVGNQNK